MSKHTPGTWKYEPEDNLIVAELPTGRFRILSMSPRSLDCDIAERGANARLIAAAPDLLEALQGLHDDTMDYIKLNNLGGENNHWLVLARFAIAKATGEKP